MNVNASLLGLLVSTAAAAAPAVGQDAVPALTLQGTDGGAYPLRSAITRGRWTVFVFFSARCPCQKAHDDRLRTLFEEYRSREVQFFLVDSEVGDALERGRSEVVNRNYPVPILADPNAQLAQALGATFATSSVVVDPTGKIRYRGGVDSSKREPDPSSQFYLKNALDALLAGRAPDPAETKSLGCYLRTS
jgi:peroxiredoxin